MEQRMCRGPCQARLVLVDEFELDCGFTQLSDSRLSAILDGMDRRVKESTAGRRTVARGGRRDGDQGRPWYLRSQILLSVASLVFVGWQRVWRRVNN